MGTAQSGSRRRRPRDRDDHDSDGDDQDLDEMESGGYRGGGGTVRRRAKGIASALAPLTPMMTKNRSVRRAIDKVDRWVRKRAQSLDSSPCPIGFCRLLSDPSPLGPVFAWKKLPQHGPYITRRNRYVKRCYANGPRATNTKLERNIYELKPILNWFVPYFTLHYNRLILLFLLLLFDFFS